MKSQKNSINIKEKFIKLLNKINKDSDYESLVLLVNEFFNQDESQPLQEFVNTFYLEIKKILDII